LGLEFNFIFIDVYMHSSPYLFLCGDDRLSCYSGADDLIGELGDA